ncbi:MAG: glycosyltransferase [Rhodospirillaceae bacterium]|nr:glycosyltransferase [Rhodospirillales bacterium]
MRITILARSLDAGGAERQLVVLAAALRQRGHWVSVLTFYPGGAMRPALEAAGVQVSSLDKRHRWDVLGFGRSLVRRLRQDRPDVVHSVLTVPNILAAIMVRLAGRPRLVWGIRSSVMDLSRFDRVSRLSYGIERLLSTLPDAIIVNSQAGLRHYAGAGYPAKRMTVIPNGIDTAIFHPDPAGRDRVRREWGVAHDTVLIGLVARLDPMKDHPTFLKAAGLLQGNVHFVCVGDGPPAYQAELTRLAASSGLDGKVLWAGARSDMPAVYSALDLDVLCSTGEGFPNVVAEAMACAVPCVATDVGDCADIVGEPSRLVPPSEPAQLAAAMAAVLALPPSDRVAEGERGRQRIIDHFSVAAMAERSLEVFRP